MKPKIMQMIAVAAKLYVIFQKKKTNEQNATEYQEIFFIK